MPSPSLPRALRESRSRDDLRSATTTPRAPASAQARATAAPIPLAAPVTTQTLPLTCMLRRLISDDDLFGLKHWFDVAAMTVNSLSPCGRGWQRCKAGGRGEGVCIRG